VVNTGNRLNGRNGRAGADWQRAMVRLSAGFVEARCACVWWPNGGGAHQGNSRRVSADGVVGHCPASCSWDLKDLERHACSDGAGHFEL
jgi:hypothetical protein